VAFSGATDVKPSTGGKENQVCERQLVRVDAKLIR
jgi:hypothetical protein